MSFQATALTLSWVAIALLALGMSGLVRQVRLLSDRPVESPTAPGSSLVGGVAPRIAAQERSWSRPTILLFVTSDCDVCEARLADLEKAAIGHDDELGFAAVYQGQPSDRLDVTSDLVEIYAGDDAAFDDYQIPITPYGVVVGTDGVVREARRVGSAGAVQELIDTAKTAKVSHAASS